MPLSLLVYNMLYDLAQNYNAEHVSRPWEIMRAITAHRGDGLRPYGWQLDYAGTLNGTELRVLWDTPQ